MGVLAAGIYFSFSGCQHRDGEGLILLVTRVVVVVSRDTSKLNRLDPTSKVKNYTSCPSYLHRNNKHRGPISQELFPQRSIYTRMCTIHASTSPNVRQGTIHHNRIAPLPV